MTAIAFLLGVGFGVVLTIWLAIAPLERAALESDDEPRGDGHA
jgi:hypothetical protein